MLHKTRLLAAGGLLVLGMAGTGSAEILFAGSHKTPATGTGTTFALVPLIDTGSFPVGFTAEPGTFVVVTYNAECSRSGTQGFVAVKIEVDGKVADPKVANDFHLCSSKDQVGAVRVAHIEVGGPSEFHEVRVRAAALGGATGWRLDDSTIVIEK